MSFEAFESVSWSAFRFSPPSEFRSPLTGSSVLGSDEQGAGRQPTKFFTRGHWKTHEDARLRELVAEQGPRNWNTIAESIPGRSGKSCRLRWFNQLDPKINKNAFTREEEERLLAAHHMYGNKWSIIAQLFPGRTDNAVKNHWHVILARRRRQQRSGSGTDASARGMYPINKAVMNSNTADNLNDESAASTCTDLSIPTSSSSSKISQHLLILHPTPVPESPPGSLVSASGGSSVADAITGYDAEMCGQNQTAAYDNKFKNKVPFFDFLGVGADGGGKMR